MTPTEVRAPDVLTAWRAAVGNLLENHQGAGYHVVVRIGSDQHDVAGQGAIDDLLVQSGRGLTEQVANTIFPSRIARTSADVSVLSARYRAIYPRLRKLDQLNHWGTYFGRLVAISFSSAAR